MISIQNVVVSKTLCGVDIRRPSSPYSPLAEGATSCSWAFCQHTDTTSDCNNTNKRKEKKLIQKVELSAKKTCWVRIVVKEVGDWLLLHVSLYLRSYICFHRDHHHQMGEGAEEE